MPDGLRKTIECPCCGGIGKIEERSPVPLSPMQLCIYDIVKKEKYGISNEALVSRIYASRHDGGPLWASISVRVQIKRANERLASAGLRIGTESRGHGALYRLKRMQVA